MDKLSRYISILCLIITTRTAGYSQISGEIIVGKNRIAPFNTLFQTFEALNKQGVNGDVRIILEDDYYETPQLVLKSIPGSKMENLIEIKPAQGVKCIISLTSGANLFSISTPCSITIDGRYSGRDEMSCITFRAQTALSFSAIVSSDPKDKMIIQIQNCFFEGDNNGKGNGISYTDDRMIENVRNDSITIKNNSFSGFKNGIFLRNSAVNCSFNKINNCRFGINIYSLNVSESYYITLHNNFFDNNTAPLYCRCTNSDMIISNNLLIGGIQSNSGMYIEDAERLYISNNIIKDFFSCGISVNNSCYVKIRHNTIRISPLKPHEGFFEPFINSCIELFSNACLENNVLELDQSLNPDPKQSFIIENAALFLGENNIYKLIENGNCYFSSSTKSNWGLSSKYVYPTYSKWINDTKQTNTTSIDKKNSFVSSTDLHLTVPNHQGIPIPEITTDIEGHPRDPFHPDAGAYEYGGNTEIQPNFTFQNTCQPTAFTFTNASSFTSPIWDFGDGQTSTLASPSHTYTATGTYTVSLTATNSSGQTQKVNKTISVYARPTAPVIKISGGK